MGKMPGLGDLTENYCSRQKLEVEWGARGLFAVFILPGPAFFRLAEIATMILRIVW